jgi:multidrug transporter EmrE-like cation transporter
VSVLDREVALDAILETARVLTRAALALAGPALAVAVAVDGVFGLVNRAVPQTLLGIILFAESAALPRLFCIGVIVAGILGLKLTSSS